MKSDKHLSVRVISLSFVNGAFFRRYSSDSQFSEHFKFSFFFFFSMCLEELAKYANFKKFFGSGLEVIGPLVHFNSFPFGASELSSSVVPPPQRDHTRE